MNLLNFLKSKRFMEIFRFGVTGGVSFLVDYGIMVALTEVFGVHYLISAGISFSVSVVVNYFLCLFWVFDTDKKKQGQKAMVIFIGSSIIGLILNQIFMWIFVDIFHIFYMISKVMATLLVMIWNYFMKRKAMTM